MPATNKNTPVQRRARRAFERLLEDAAGADAIYNSIPDSRGGSIISTDIARYLDATYRDTPKGQPKDLWPGWDCAWRYAHNRLTRELRSRSTRKFVRFMAGGWAAGKTHALETQKPPDLAWDGTLGDVQWASAMIELAISKGWLVDIAYVYRDIELALYGAIERNLKEGRGVPLGRLPATHRTSQRSILHLIRRYRRNPQVGFTLVHNFGAKGIKGEPVHISYANLASAGALHYTEEYESYYSQAALQIEALNPA